MQISGRKFLEVLADTGMATAGSFAVSARPDQKVESSSVEGRQRDFANTGSAPNMTYHFPRLWQKTEQDLISTTSSQFAHTPEHASLPAEIPIFSECPILPSGLKKASTD
jgi:hypothetical protein